MPATNPRGRTRAAIVRLGHSTACSLESGDQEALQDLIPLVYKELRLAAHRCLKAERPDHTLQSTELVHEVFLRLAGDRPPLSVSRAHFVAIAAKLMRQILVDYARRRAARKRGPQYKVELDESFWLPEPRIM
jgi:RNA polymerase sigma factor (TIGR02999 family)